MAHLEFFHPARIALGEEVVLHPELKVNLSNHASDEFEIKLAEVAAYCNVIVDGEYLPEDFDELCELLLWRLRAKRAAQVAAISKPNH